MDIRGEEEILIFHLNGCIRKKFSIKFTFHSSDQLERLFEKLVHQITWKISLLNVRFRQFRFFLWSIAKLSSFLFRTFRRSSSGCRAKGKVNEVAHETLTWTKCCTDSSSIPYIFVFLWDFYFREGKSTRFWCSKFMYSKLFFQRWRDEYFMLKNLRLLRWLPLLTSCSWYFINLLSERNEKCIEIVFREKA